VAVGAERAVALDAKRGVEGDGIPHGHLEFGRRRAGGVAVGLEEQLCAVRGRVREVRE
jgi:hypothetical protein